MTGNLPPSGYELVPGAVDIFPSFSNSSMAFIVDAPADAGQGLMLTLSTLQGIVNRHGAQVYLRTGLPGNMSFLLPFIEGRYPIDFSSVTHQTFLHDFSSYATGLVVYDPALPATVNIATVEAGLRDYIVVDPSSAENVSQVTGLPVALDLRKPPWSGMTAIQMYRKSFRELYGECYHNMLAILPEDRYGGRDYFVAAKIWTFNAGQGPFSPQEEIDFTEEILAATPHNIPILGWFRTPSLTEENFFVQSMSRHGKFILGGQDVPNLSFLAGVAPAETFKQKRVIPPLPSLTGDGIYMSFAVPDGDNLDFVSNRMHEMWLDDVRGTVPIAWSINPLLANLAPPLLDYYYSEATTADSFVAAPSGAGYLYPGFTPQSDLKEYLVRTRNSMAAADMDVVWLLNSFTAGEIPYSEETIETYVTEVAPRGIVLDYADQAVTRDVWMQGGDGSASPVIRSTHLWSGRDNLIGKIMVDVDASPSRQHFFLVVVYPWTLQLGEAVGAIDTLRCRYGDRVSVVSIENLFSLVTGSFIEYASRTTAESQENLLASLDPWDMDAARDLLEQSRVDVTNGEIAKAGFHAYSSIQHAQRALAVGLIVLLVVVSVAVLMVSFLILKVREGPSGRLSRRKPVWLYPGLASAALFYLFFSGLQKAIEYYFWTYASVFVGGLVVVFAPKIQTRLQSMLRFNLWPVEAGILAVSGLFLMREPWAFVPFACACAMLLCRFLRCEGFAREKAAVFAGLGVAGSIFVSFDWLSLAVVVAVLVELGYLLRPLAPLTRVGEERGKPLGVSFAATTLALTFVWLSLIQNRYFTERADGGLGLLYGLSVITLVVVPVLAISIWRAVGPLRKAADVLILAATTAVWVLAWFVQDLTVFALLLTVIAVMICLSYMSASSRVEWNDRTIGKFVSGVLVLGAVVVILIRLPAIVYSLYVYKLPLAGEYVLYTPPLLMIFATLDIVQTEVLFRAARKGAEKKSKDAPLGE